MNPSDKEKLDMQARAQQMKINTRLTALQTALTVMGTSGYSQGVAGTVRTNGSGEALATPQSVWMHRPQPVDHLTLLAMAGDIEKYILGEIEQETKDALDALNKPKPTIVPAKDMPASKFRP